MARTKQSVREQMERNRSTFTKRSSPSSSGSRSGSRIGSRNGSSGEDEITREILDERQSESDDDVVREKKRFKLDQDETIDGSSAYNSSSSTLPHLLSPPSSNLAGSLIESDLQEKPNKSFCNYLLSSSLPDSHPHFTSSLSSSSSSSKTATLKLLPVKTDTTSLNKVQKDDNNDSISKQMDTLIKTINLGDNFEIVSEVSRKPNVIENEVTNKVAVLTQGSDAGTIHDLSSSTIFQKILI